MFSAASGTVDKVREALEMVGVMDAACRPRPVQGLWRGTSPTICSEQAQPAACCQSLHVYRFAPQAPACPACYGLDCILVLWDVLQKRIRRGRTYTACMRFINAQRNAMRQVALSLLACRPSRGPSLTGAATRRSSVAEPSAPAATEQLPTSPAAH